MKFGDSTSINRLASHWNIVRARSQVFALGYPRIVDQNIELWKRVMYFSRERVDGRSIGNVELHTAHAGIGSSDFVEKNQTAANNEHVVPQR